MANYLDANPNDAGMIASHQRDGHMVPIAKGGAFLAMVNRQRINRAPLDTHLSVEDYIVGLELLGYRFHLQKGQGGAPSLFREEPDLPSSWDAHALRIVEAFGPNRNDEVRAFIIKRDSGL